MVSRWSRVIGGDRGDCGGRWSIVVVQGYVQVDQCVADHASLM